MGSEQFSRYRGIDNVPYVSSSTVKFESGFTGSYVTEERVTNSDGPFVDEATMGN